MAPREEDLDLALGAAGRVLVLHAPVPGPQHLVLRILISAITRFNQLIRLYNGCLLEVYDTIY